MNVQDQDQPPKRGLWLLTLGYLFFVVYGSLLPFNFKPLNFAVAWTSFQSIPWLNLGVEQRADWVANLLLYMPLGFFLSGLLVGRSRRVAVGLIGIALAWLFGSVVATGVEFTQLFFPPRTVSQNDLYAEVLGTLFGAAAWLFGGVRLQDLWRAIWQGGEHSRYALLLVYALGYIVLALFPYDFLLSADEWRASIAQKAGWLIAPICSNHCWLNVLGEILVVSPLGALAFGSRRSSLAAAGVAGLLLGILIELLQLTIATGISQGVSVISRGLGFLLGAGVMRYARDVDWHWLRPWVRMAVWFCGFPYLLVVAWLNHWFAESWLGLYAGFARLPGVHFMPFYYHYFTTETEALVSLLHQFGLYLPLGLAVWGWRWSRLSSVPERGWVLSALWATLVAGLIESGKLFMANQHPDPTNILIAATAAASAYRLLSLLCANAPSLLKPSRVESVNNTLHSVRPVHWGWFLLGLSALILASAAALTNPLGAGFVFLALLGYGLLIWRFPGLTVVLVLTLLPLLDFTPWTGRLFWSEFDTLLLVTLGVGYLRYCTQAVSERLPIFPNKLWLAAFALSTIIGVGIGVLPLAPLDLNAFASYTSPYNALRNVKGILFALLFLPLLRREWRDPARASRHLAIGMSLGAALEVIYVLWERRTFPGLLNFETDYRITGSFPGMHVGGAYIEAYLVIALSFVMLWVWQKRSVGVFLTGAVLYALVAYSVMVTFSRGGQAAFVFVTVATVLGFARLLWIEGKLKRMGLALLVGTLSLAALTAWPIFSSQFNQSRIATSEHDLDTRVAHWQDAWQILVRRGGVLIGAGLGSFPSAYYWGSKAPERPATYAFATQNKNVYLRLGGGESLYFEQILPVQPARHYTLSLDLAANINLAELSVSLCEKALLYSFECVWGRVKPTTALTQWAHYQLEFSAAKLGASGTLFSRPVKLALLNPRTGSVLNIDHISLRDDAGHNLVRNGDFTQGMQHWFFSTDSHLPWHEKNLFLHILFEQGLLGLSIFIVLIFIVLKRLARSAWDGDVTGLSLFVALAAFLGVGLIDSLIDETRLGFLFFYLLFTGLIWAKWVRPKRVLSRS